MMTPTIGDQTRTARQREIDAFVTDPDVAIAVCSLTAAGVGINLQVASNIVLAELSWTAAEQTQAIDRVHRIGQDQPVTAWRIIAAQTIDARIAQLIDAKAGLAAHDTIVAGAQERNRRLLEQLSKDEFKVLLDQIDRLTDTAAQMLGDEKELN